MNIAGNQKQVLSLTFDINTIDHLGSLMYKTLPPVLSEMISNSYDADAENSEIEFIDKDGYKEIIISDDGNGMTFEEINNSFLRIGRNRRNENKADVSPNKGRKVTGRKGIGKLAVFGIADKITIETIKDGLLNKFEMSYSDIKNCNSGIYNPHSEGIDIPVNAPNGTRITLSAIKRSTNFNLTTMQQSIAKRFAFKDDDFIVQLKSNSDVKIIDNRTKWESLESQNSWTFPNDEFSEKYNIQGEIKISKTPLDDDTKGVFLYARNKLVNSNEFYGVKSTNNLVFNYLTGELNIDFIDDGNEDFVNTSRDGLMWENSDEIIELRNWLKKTIQSIGNEQRKIWDEEKKKRLSEEKNFSVDKWIKSIPEEKQVIAAKVASKIYEYEKLEPETIVNLLSDFEEIITHDNFEELNTELENQDIEDCEVVNNLKNRSSIERSQFKEILNQRITVINKFKTDEILIEKFSNFIKEASLPWLLDSGIYIYQDIQHLRSQINKMTPEGFQIEDDVLIYESANKNILVKICEEKDLKVVKEEYLKFINYSKGKFSKDFLGIILSDRKVLRLSTDRIEEYTSSELLEIASNNYDLTIEYLDRTPLKPNSIYELDSINPGREDATEYHNFIFNTLSHVFSPYLGRFKKEVKSSNKRHRIDIVSYNQAESGFFNELNSKSQAKCPIIPIECKNYANDINNPEIDQISARLGEDTGHFGIIVCRSIDDNYRLVDICKQHFYKSRKYIIVLEDSDIKQLIEYKLQDNYNAINDLLRDKFTALLMK